eukprot:UN05148
MILIVSNLQMPVETFRIWKNILAIKDMYLLHLLEYLLLVQIFTYETKYLAAENNILPLCDNTTQITSSLPSENTIFSMVYNVARNISYMPQIPQVHTDYLRFIGSNGGSITRIQNVKMIYFMFEQSISKIFACLQKERRIYWTLKHAHIM